MSAVSDMADALLAALRAVDGMRASLDVGGTVNPPETVLGPPTLTWDAYCSGPSTGTFTAYVVVAQNDRAMEQLWDLLPALTEAVDSVPDAVVTRATPGTFTSGGASLPAYLLTIEVSL